MANEKRNLKSGKFTTNPNSKRQQKLREKAAKAAQAFASPTGTVETVSAPVKTAENAATEAPRAETNAQSATVKDAATDTHTTEWYPPPPKPIEPEILPDFDDSDDGESEQENEDSVFTSDEKPKASRAQKAKSKRMATMVVGLLDQSFETYVTIRHPWLQMIVAENPGLKNLAGCSEEEKTILVDSLARYMEENQIEMSPGQELALFMGLFYGARIVALEGMLAKSKRM